MAKSKVLALPRVQPRVQPGLRLVALWHRPPLHFAIGFLPPFSKHLVAEVQLTWKQGVWFHRNKDLMSHHPKGNGHRLHHSLWSELRFIKHFLTPE